MPALEDCWFAIFNNKELKFYIRSSSAGNWISLAWGIRVYLRPARRKFGPAAGLFAEEFGTVPSSWLTGKGTMLSACLLFTYPQSVHGRVRAMLSGGEEHPWTKHLRWRSSVCGS